MHVTTNTDDVLADEVAFLDRELVHGALAGCCGLENPIRIRLAEKRPSASENTLRSFSISSWQDKNCRLLLFTMSAKLPFLHHHPTHLVTAPVITILSSSAAGSRQAIERLCEWTSLGHQSLVDHQTTARTTEFHHVIPWTVDTSQCQETGTTIKWLSPAHSSLRIESDANPRHHLLAIQASKNQPLIVSCTAQNKNIVQQLFDSTLSRRNLKLSNWFRRPVQPSYLLGPSLVPRLQINNEPAMGDADIVTVGAVSTPPPSVTSRSGLKELVIPIEEESVESFVTELSQSPGVTSPVTGLYLLPSSSLCLRPLPTGLQDRKLPPPSLIFHMSKSSIDDYHPATSGRMEGIYVDDCEKSKNVLVRKIGYSGGTINNRSSSGGGQVRLESKDWTGLDVRLCNSNKYSSMFAEAHESLLAGSIDQLQSSHVLGKGSIAQESSLKDETGDSNPRIRDKDCWMEFRATLRRPSEYFRKRRPKLTAAKAPDLPYE